MAHKRSNSVPEARSYARVPVGRRLTPVTGTDKFKVYGMNGISIRSWLAVRRQ
jgi:hypothetical protein